MSTNQNHSKTKTLTASAAGTRCSTHDPKPVRPIRHVIDEHDVSETRFFVKIDVSNSGNRSTAGSSSQGNNIKGMAAFWSCLGHYLFGSQLWPVSGLRTRSRSAMAESQSSNSRGRTPALSMYVAQREHAILNADHCSPPRQMLPSPSTASLARPPSSPTSSISQLDRLWRML